MEIITIIWFLIFAKLLLFWLWLWQLKEYRFDRLRAHFEAMAFGKIISGFWRIKYPKFTNKISLIFLTCLIIEALFIFYLPFFWVIFSTIFFIPLVILLFQIPTFLWQKIVINKATLRRAQFKDLLVIGITGSYGKTSVKEFLTVILSSKFKVLSTPAHQNTDIAIAQLILKKLTKDIEIFIVEMAAYKKGEITSPCLLAKPKIGILTAINEQHLSTYGSLENTIQTKYELIGSLPKDGLAIFNGDNSYCHQLYKTNQNKKRIYSIQPSIGGFPADIHVINLTVNKEFLTFKLVNKKGESSTLNLNLLGKHNVSNILAAACCAVELGMSLEEIASACQKIESRQSGIRLSKGTGDLNVIDATYSANPDGVMSHLEYLKIWSGKKIIIMPCLIELGQASKKIHKEIGRKIGQICDLAVITSRERFQELSEGATEKGMKRENILFTDNPKEIFEKINSFLKYNSSSKSSTEENVVLLESRVPDRLVSLLIIND